MQKQTEFKIGNIVHVKSGSPDMKIVDIQGENVAVEWRNDLGDPQQGVFLMVCLR